MISILDILALGFIVFVEAFFPFINKKLIENIESFPFTAIRWIIGGLIGLCFIPFHQQIYTQNISLYFIIALLSVFSFIASSIYYYLLKKYDANVIAVIMNPLIIFSSALFGTLLFNEPFTKQMWLGTFIILIGLTIFIRGKV